MHSLENKPETPFVHQSTFGKPFQKGMAVALTENTILLLNIDRRTTANCRTQFHTKNLMLRL